MITRQQLIKKYVEFFKKHKHKHIPSSSLVPENDPTVLFTTAGMHPLVPYIQGQKHPLGKRLVNIQKCIRTGDIEEVGDSCHHTFFEMLGNWSLGDYWKEEAIQYTFEFLTKELKIPKERLAVSCFAGNKDSPRDEDSARIWESLGISKKKIVFLDKNDNWWGPAGETGPCGPDTEVFYWTSEEKVPNEFNPNDSTLATDGENWVEIGNNVLIQYNKLSKSKFEPLKQKTIDFGGGLERMLTILNGLEDSYQSPVFLPIIKIIEKLSSKTYKDNQKAMRIIADHIKAAVFILGDSKSIKPSNLGQGYVLRRLIRRAIRYKKILGIGEPLSKLLPVILKIYPDHSELSKNKKFIKEQLEAEEQKFQKTLEKGLKKFQQLSKDDLLTGKEAFLLFQSYGFPIEMTQELCDEKSIKIDLEEYNQEFKKHQDLSRSASSGMFKSGLADSSQETKKLHTATHLLNEALRHVLNKDIKQKGSNITPERLRFDFNFPRKLTPEEKEKIESFINDKISAKLPIERSEMPLKQALKDGAQSEFGAKYPELVSVYTIIDKKDKRGYFSKEICTGPHVKNTSELGSFKIIKEESSAAGIRRIKAKLE